MTINLHNYEEYFLLYADNELSDLERQEVLEFIKTNPHLEEEWKMICDAVLIPEPLTYNFKNALLKEEPQGIGTGNYEDYFVQYHDNELNEEEKEEVIQFLQSHPSLQNDFDLIGKARLVPEAIRFPNIHTLLKKEPAGKIRVLIYRSMAAAAVIMAAILLLNSGSFFTNDEVPQIAGSATFIPEKNEATPDKQPDLGTTSTAAVENSVSPESESTERMQHSAPVVRAQYASQTAASSGSKKNPSRTLIAKEIPEKSISENIRITTPIAETAPVIIARTTVHIDVDETPVQAQNNVRQVVHLNVDNEPDFFFNSIPGDDIKRTKLGGFLKKVKRMAERNDPIKRLFEGDEVAAK